MTSVPLSARVSAPSTVEIPTSVPGVTWRAATVADAPAIHACERAIGTADHPRYTTPLEEIEDDFAHSYMDASTDSLLAIADDGQVLAWGMVALLPGQDTLVRSVPYGGVRPDQRGRGLGRQLLEWQRGRGLQQLASSEKTLPGWLVLVTEDFVEATKKLFDRFGFSPARYFLELRRDLTSAVEPVPLGEGLRIEAFTKERSEETRLARNDAFRDHWGSQPSTDEQWKSLVDSSIFRPQLSHVAIDTTVEGGAVAGFVLSTVNEEDWPGVGFSSAYIELVGVARHWRGRGIAPALLAHTLAAIAAEGLEVAALDVDSDSPTGALGLYERQGFRQSHRIVNYTSVH
ncbi:MAG: GNAT family N-acetyltransferase [Rhodoglobus sp.]